MNQFTESEHAAYIARQERERKVICEHPELRQTHWTQFPAKLKAFVGKPIKATGTRTPRAIYGGNLPSSRRIAQITAQL